VFFCSSCVGAISSKTPKAPSFQIGSEWNSVWWSSYLGDNHVHLGDTQLGLGDKLSLVDFRPVGLSPKWPYRYTYNYCSSINTHRLTHTVSPWNIWQKLQTRIFDLASQFQLASLQVHAKCCHLVRAHIASSRCICSSVYQNFLIHNTFVLVLLVQGVVFPKTC